MKLKLSGAKGITLIEIVITVSITMVIGLVLANILLNSTSLQVQEEAKVSQGLGLNDALFKIRSTAKSAYAVAISYPETPPVQYTSSPSELVLKIPTIDVSGNMIKGSFDYFVYYTTTNFLKEKVFPSPQSKLKSSDQILARNVSKVTFDYLDINNNVVSPTATAKIKISLQLTEQAGLEKQESISTSEAVLRNF